MEWKDITTYRNGEKDRTPTTFSAKCGPMRLVVTSSHIHYPGKWVAHGFPIFENKAITATSCEGAQVEAVQIAFEWLNAALESLKA